MVLALSMPAKLVIGEGSPNEACVDPGQLKAAVPCKETARHPRESSRSLRNNLCRSYVSPGQSPQASPMQAGPINVSDASRPHKRLRCRAEPSDNLIIARREIGDAVLLYYRPSLTYKCIQVYWDVSNVPVCLFPSIEPAPAKCRHLPTT
jgi:hypothetical protein